MTWRNSLRDATFKGIGFKVENHDTEYSRRTVVNEYPFRNMPYVEDMGRAAKRYNFEAYIVGSDYYTARDNLLNAIEEGGAGILIHPYLGTLTVICTDCRFRESQQEGGMIRFSLSFVEAGELIYPNGDLIPAGQVLAGADSLIAAAQNDFISNIDLNGVSEWVRTDYSNGLTAAANIFNDIRTNGGINNQATTQLINTAADWVANITELTNPALTLISDVKATADKIKTTFAGLLTLAPSNDEAVLNLEKFTNYNLPKAPISTALAIKANNNSTALERFIKSAAIANESKAAINRNYGSYDEAISARKGLLTRIDTLAGDTDSDDIYESFRSLRASVSKAIPNEESSLPRIQTLQLNKTLPSLVLSYDLYETVDREADLIARNSIRHPGFMPGGQNLSILDYE